jgi:hypothetical protein
VSKLIDSYGVVTSAYALRVNQWRRYEEAPLARRVRLLLTTAKRRTKALSTTNSTRDVKHPGFNDCACDKTQRRRDIRLYVGGIYTAQYV